MGPGHANGVVCRITILPGCVVGETWKQIPPHLHGSIKQELQKMLDKGIIRESRSQWQSPRAIVPKKDGSLHLCIDFRKVNAVAKFVVFPMPGVEDMTE